jgi:hypothetical protein
MPAGSTWYLRLSDPHSVANRGPRARVHLVVDLVVNAWLAALFERALAAEAGRGGLSSDWRRLNPVPI